MMFPLCTRVTLRRLLLWAYSMAARTSRSLPSRDTGLKPMAVVSGKRIFRCCAGKRSFRKASTAFASSVPWANSMPA